MARLGRSPVRAHATAAQYRQIEDLQAQEPGRPADVVPRTGLSAGRCAISSSCSHIHPATGEQEVSSFEEFVDGFDWDKVSTVGPIFDVKKLDWLNGVYIRALPTEQLADRIIAYALESGQWSEVPPKVAISCSPRHC